MKTRKTVWALSLLLAASTNLSYAQEESLESFAITQLQELSLEKVEEQPETLVDVTEEVDVLAKTKEKAQELKEKILSELSIDESDEIISKLEEELKIKFSSHSIEDVSKELDKKINEMVEEKSKKELEVSLAAAAEHKTYQEQIDALKEQVEVLQACTLNKSLKTLEDSPAEKVDKSDVDFEKLAKELVKQYPALNPLMNNQALNVQQQMMNAQWEQFNQYLQALSAQSTKPSTMTADGIEMKNLYYMNEINNLRIQNLISGMTYDNSIKTNVGAQPAPVYNYTFNGDYSNFQRPMLDDQAALYHSPFMMNNSFYSERLYNPNSMNFPYYNGASGYNFRRISIDGGLGPNGQIDPMRVSGAPVYQRQFQGSPVNFSNLTR